MKEFVKFYTLASSTQVLFSDPFLRVMATYSQEYSAFKPDKKLRWLPQLGTVDLEIELKDRKIEVQVPPLEAAIIELFSEKRSCQLCVCFI